MKIWPRSQAHSDLARALARDEDWFSGMRFKHYRSSILSPLIQVYLYQVPSYKNLERNQLLPTNSPISSCMVDPLNKIGIYH